MNRFIYFLASYKSLHLTTFSNNLIPKCLLAMVPIVTHGLSPRFSIEINDIPSILDLVKTGKWHTIMVQTSVQGQDFLTIPLKEKTMSRTAMIISLKEAYEKKATKKFLDFLLNLKAKY